MNNELRDRLEMFITVSVALGAIAAAFVATAAAVGIFFGIAHAAFTWVT